LKLKLNEDTAKQHNHYTFRPTLKKNRDKISRLVVSLLWSSSGEQLSLEKLFFVFFNRLAFHPMSSHKSETMLVVKFHLKFLHIYVVWA